jgi:hypothetical protein
VRNLPEHRAPTGLYDPYQRGIAARLERDRSPLWVVWWGVGSRRYWAVPTWQGAPVSLVDGRTPNDLTAAMHAVEVGSFPVRTGAGSWGTS